MEDAATAEISRSQVWQWIHHGATLNTGQRITRELVLQFEQEELDKIRQGLSDEASSGHRFDEAQQLFEQVALSQSYTEFLSLPAYEHID
jgi:malate synthase